MSKTRKKPEELTLADLKMFFIIFERVAFTEDAAPEKVGRAFQAAVRYARTTEISDITDGEVSLIFQTFKRLVDESYERWMKQVRAGQKGGINRDSRPKPTLDPTLTSFEEGSTYQEEKEDKDLYKDEETDGILF